MNGRTIGAGRCLSGPRFGERAESVIMRIDNGIVLVPAESCL
jgi:hypothetical protein